MLFASPMNIERCKMGLFDSEIGKRRLLAIEIPILERYNADRADDFKIKVVRQNQSLLLRYRLKPMHNVYELETRLPSIYPAIPPETHVITAAQVLPASSRWPAPVHVAARQHARNEPLGPREIHLRVCGAGGVALAGLLRNLA